MPSSFSNHEPLTNIETEVLEQIANGATDKEVACRLLIYEGAVKKHVHSLVEKLGVRDRAGAVALGLSKNLHVTAVPPPLGKSDAPAPDAPKELLLNQRELSGALEREIGTAAQQAQPLSVVLVAIEFTQPTDPYGHPQKDGLFRYLVEVLVQVSDEDAWVARYGQDHFVLVLPQTPKRKALLIGEQVFRRVKEVRVAPSFHLTVALGVSTLPEDGITADGLLHAAEQAVRDSKRLGGNRISIFRANP